MKIRDTHFSWGKRTYLMGILNVTPDSFSDGGQFNKLGTALKQANTLVKEGADILDIGGQSTRPGAVQISLEEELSRVLPVVEKVRQEMSIPISVDTTRAKVAKSAVELGADIINDISGGTFDEEMLPTVAKLQVPIILMHIKGIPETMQQKTDYQDLIGEIISFLSQQIDAAMAEGVERSQIIIDPGIGFGKTYQHNLEILNRLQEFTTLNAPILIGTSRKSFIGHILNQKDPQKRVWGTAATCCAAIANHADILRVHDVKQMCDVCRVADAIWR